MTTEEFKRKAEKTAGDAGRLARRVFDESKKLEPVLKTLATIRKYVRF